MQEELYNAKGERIFSQEDIRPRSSGSVPGVDTKNAVIAVLIGICGGWLASFVVGSGGIFHYLITGVLGSYVGSGVLNLLGINLGIRNEIGRDVATATIGAIIVMLVANWLT